MMNKTVKYWIPVVLWMSVTLTLSTGLFSGDNTSRIITPILKFLIPSISPHQIQLLHLIIRKSAHITEYFIMSLLLFRAFRRNSTEKHLWRWVLSSVLVFTLFAVSDEIHQSIVVTRTASIIDVLIDVLGGVIGQCVCIIFYYHRQRSN